MSDTPKPTLGYLTAGCGCFLTLIAFAVAAFGGFHVFLDPRGKISGEEALPALGGGVCCALGSFVIFGIGVFVAMQAKKKAAAMEQDDPPKMG